MTDVLLMYFLKRSSDKLFWKFNAFSKGNFLAEHPCNVVYLYWCTLVSSKLKFLPKGHNFFVNDLNLSKEWLLLQLAFICFSSHMLEFVLAICILDHTYKKYVFLAIWILERERNPWKKESLEWESLKEKVCKYLL